MTSIWGEKKREISIARIGVYAGADTFHGNLPMNPMLKKSYDLQHQNRLHFDLEREK
jgi:hypothetical protein